MSNLKILIKNSFHILLGSLQKKKERKKTSVMIILTLLGFFGFLALSTLQAYTQFFGLAPLGLSKVVLFNGYLIAISVVILIAVMKITGKNKTTDADLLLSLPIKKSTIALSQTIVKYLFDLAFMILLLLPYLVLYLIYTSFSWTTLLLGILTIFLLPVLSVGISYILNHLVVHLFNKTKHADLLKSLTAVAGFLLFMFLYGKFMPSYGTLDPNQVDAFINGSGIIGWFINFVTNPTAFTTISVLLITIVPFIVGILLYARNFGQTFVGYKVTNLELNYGNGKAFSSLLKKEIKNYFTTPIFLLNTIIGPFFMIAFTVFISIKGIDGMTQLIMMPNSKEFLFAISTLALCSFTILTLISCSTISLEGKNLWILKTMPVSETNIFLSKTLLNVIMTAPILLICGPVLGIFLQFPWYQVLLLTFIPVLVSFIISFAGVYINLLFPKFEWTDEVQVVKQGASIMITMVIGFLLVLIPVGLYFAFEFFAFATIGLLTAFIYATILFVVIYLLFTRGKQLFQEL